MGTRTEVPGAEAVILFHEALSTSLEVKLLVNVTSTMTPRSWILSLHGLSEDTTIKLVYV